MPFLPIVEPVNNGTRDVWPGVEAVVRRATSDEGLAVHRLGLVAEHVGVRAADPSLLRERLLAFARVQETKRALRAIREVLDGPVVAFKGVAVASHYPNEVLRPYGDLDVLVPDAQEAHRKLIEAGFLAGSDKPEEYYDGLHHVQPLWHPEKARIAIELHSRVSWTDWSPAPPTSEVLAAARPGPLDVDGILEPDPAQHLLIIIAHSANALPLRHLGDLLDVALLLQSTTPEAVEVVAERWDATPMWKLYARALEEQFFGASPKLGVRLLAPHFDEVRDATVLESHTRRWLGPLWVQGGLRGARWALQEFVDDLLPVPGESWQNKRYRMGQALRNRKNPLLDHAEELGRDHVRPRHRGRVPEAPDRRDLR